LLFSPKFTSISFSYKERKKVETKKEKEQKKLYKTEEKVPKRLNLLNPHSPISFDV